MSAHGPFADILVPITDVRVPEKTGLWMEQDLASDF
jgi:hypothetical protein